MTVVCHDKVSWQAYAASPKVKPKTIQRAQNTPTSGVPERYGSSTEPIVAVAPLASNGPTHCLVELRTNAALNECRWYANAPGMNSTVFCAKGPDTSPSYHPQ